MRRIVPWMPLLALVGCPKPAPVAAGARFAEIEEAAHRTLEDTALEAREVVDDWVVEATEVHTAAGEVFAPGAVLVQDGRIAYVGAPDGLPACEDCVRTTRDGVITPGIIDTHSHLGVYPSPHLRAHGDGNEATAPTTPGVWAEASTWPHDPGFQRAVAGGITTLQILPGSANLVGGRGVTMRPLPTRGSRAMRFPGAPETVKMACGENPKRVYGDRGGPSTRMGNVRGYREVFARAAAHREALDGGGDVKRDVDLETLVGILEGDFLPQVHCYRSDDMLGFLQVAKEFAFSVRGFHHALEAYKIRDILAAEDVSISTWSDWWGFKAEAYDAVLANAAMVTAAGGKTVIHSDDAKGIQRLNQEAAKAWYDGLDAGFEVSRDDALRWITWNAAWTLGIEDQTGSLEVGKRADLVLWDGDPLTLDAVAQRVWIDGVLVFDVAQPRVWSDFEIGQEAGR